MSSNRLLATLLASAAILWPAAADATVGTGIGEASLPAGSLSYSMTTTGAVPAGGRLVVVSLFTGSVTATGAPTLTGCTMTAGAASVFSTYHSQQYYCTAASTIAAGTVISQGYSSTAGLAMALAVSYPATVTTHDLTGSSGGSGTSASFTTASPASSSSVVIETATTPSENITAYNEDAAVSPILSPSGNPYVGQGCCATIWVTERVLSSTSAMSYANSFAPTGPWTVTWDSFAYSAGGATCTGGRMLRGVGGC